MFEFWTIWWTKIIILVIGVVSCINIAMYEFDLHDVYGTVMFGALIFFLPLVVALIVRHLYLTFPTEE